MGTKGQEHEDTGASGSGELHRVYLGLGSNLGDRQTNIQLAIELISERVGEILQCSSLIETEPWGFESENKFLNGVILSETALTPRQVLLVTQKIERELGRKKKAVRRASSPDSSEGAQLSEAHGQSAGEKTRAYSDRPIDIDILLYDDLTVDEPGLKIPHPLMRERDFVMIPLREMMENR